MFIVKLSKCFGGGENTSSSSEQKALHDKCCAALKATQDLEKEKVILSLQFEELNKQLANGQDLQKQYKRLKAERNTARSGNKCLKTQVQDLQRKLKSQEALEEKRRAARTDRDRFLEENQALQQQLGLLSSRLQDCKALEKERKAMKAENKALIRSNKALQKKVLNLQRELSNKNDFEEKNKQAQEKNRDLTKVRTELQQQEQALQDKVRNEAQTEADFLDLEALNETLPKQNETLQCLHLDTNKDLKSEIDASSQEAELEPGHKNSSQADLGGTEAAEANADSPSTCELTSETTILRGDHKKVGREKTKKGLQRKVNKVMDALSLKEAKNVELHEKLEEMNALIKSIRADHLVQEVQKKELKRKTVRQSKQIKVLRLQIMKLNKVGKNKRSLQSKVKKVKDALNLKEAENGGLHKELEGMKELLKTLKTDYLQQEVQKEEPRDERERLSNQIETLKFQVTELNKVGEENEEEKESLQLEVIKLRDVLSHWKAENGDLHKELEWMKDLLNSIRTDHRQVEAQKEELRVERERLSNQIETLKFQVTELNKVGEENEEEKESLQLEVIQLRDVLHLCKAENEGLHKKLELMKDLLKTLKTDYLQQEVQTEELRDEREKLSNQIETLKFQVTELNKVGEENEEEKESLQLEVIKLRDILSHWKAENGDLHKELEGTKDLLNSIRTDHQQDEVKKKELRTEIERQSKLIKKLRFQATELTRVREEKESLQMKVTELMDVLRLKETECDDLHNELEDMKAIAKTLWIELENSKAEPLSSPEEVDEGELEESLTPTSGQHDDRRGIRLLRVVSGSFHQGSYRFKYGGVQCMAIAAVSIAKHTIKSVFSWDWRDLDHTVVTGDEMYTSLRDSAAFTHPSDMLTIPDLPKQLTIDGQEFGFFPDETLSGDLNVTEGEFIDLGVLVSLRSGLEKIFCQFSACLLTICRYTSAIISEDGRFAVVDSHARNDIGLSHDDGTSVILQFACLDDLHDYIYCLFSSSTSLDKPFELCGIIVLK